MKRLLLSVALAGAIPLPAPAADIPAGTMLAERQEFAFWMQAPAGPLDPALDGGPEAAALLRNLFEGLMTEDATGAPIPALAESHAESDDGLTHTFRLRPAVWSNGDPVTAGDFVFAWRRVADPETAGAAWFPALMNVENAALIARGEAAPDSLGISAPDDRTVEVRLTRRMPGFLAALSHPATFPVPESVVRALGADWTAPGNLVGNGAFLLQAQDPAAGVALAKNPLYRDADSVVMQTVRGVVENDVNAALSRYLAGELDLAPAPPGQFPQLRAEYPDQAVAVPLLCTYAYVLNLSEKGPQALKDPRVRQALQLGLDREGIVDRVLQGGQAPAWTWTPPGIDGFTPPDLPAAAMTPDDRMAEARRLLAEAGFNEETPLRLTLQYNSDETHRRIAQAAQQAWRAVGIETGLNNLDWKAHETRMQNGEFQIARYGWCGDYNAPPAFLDWFTAQDYGGWANADFAALMDAAAVADDAAPLYALAEEIIATEIPVLTVYHYAAPRMIRPEVRGFSTANPMGRWYARELYRVAE